MAIAPNADRGVRDLQNDAFHVSKAPWFDVADYRESGLGRKNAFACWQGTNSQNERWAKAVHFHWMGEREERRVG